MTNGIVLLTGFLGAGKTTFLNNILHEFENSKVGLIVNEFSKTGVDGALIRKDIPGAQMVELNNGSIFCACIKDSFTESLVEMGTRGLEYVFVEASGLADPSSISSTLEQLDEMSKVHYDYLGAICLADAVQFPKHSKVLVSLQRQVQYSRAVVLNKIDLASEEQIAASEAAIRAIKANVPIYRTSYSQVSLRSILENTSAVEEAAQESTNTVSTRPVTVTLKTTEDIPCEDLYAFLDEIAEYTFRVKGFCRTAEGTKEISMVGAYRQTQSWPINVSETQLVIISSVGVKIISVALNAAKKYFKMPVSLN